MKKIFLLLSVTILLSGCFGLFEKTDDEADDGVSVEDTDTGDYDAPPSLKDGDLYIEALKTRDKKYCGNIADAALREDCTQKIK